VTGESNEMVQYNTPANTLYSDKMAGSKKKKLSAPQVESPPLTMTGTSDDGELMNDLLAQLDSRDERVQSESATVLNEMQLNKQADQIEPGRKQDAKGRFKARQVSIIDRSPHESPLSDGGRQERLLLSRRIIRQTIHWQKPDWRRKPGMKRKLSKEFVMIWMYRFMR
jgi:hypothetical protein